MQRSIFPSMKWLAPSTDDVAKSDEEITRNIANQLITSEGQAPQGYIVEGFPFNVKQALLLDRYIKGVNLAIYFRSQNKSHEETITELLDYYDQRVHLLLMTGQPCNLELLQEAKHASDSQALARYSCQHQAVIMISGSKNESNQISRQAVLPPLAPQSRHQRTGSLWWFACSASHLGLRSSTLSSFS